MKKADYKKIIKDEIDYLKDRFKDGDLITEEKFQVQRKKLLDQ